MKEKPCTSFVCAREKQIDSVCQEKKLVLSITISEVCSKGGIHHLKELISSLLWAIRVSSLLTFVFPFFGALKYLL